MQLNKSKTMNRIKSEVSARASEVYYKRLFSVYGDLCVAKKCMPTNFKQDVFIKVNENF